MIGIFKKFLERIKNTKIDPLENVTKAYGTENGGIVYSKEPPMILKKRSIETNCLNDVCTIKDSRICCKSCSDRGTCNLKCDNFDVPCIKEVYF